MEPLLYGGKGAVRELWGHSLTLHLTLGRERRILFVTLSGMGAD